MQDKKTGAGALVYAGLGVQWLLLMGLGVWGGLKLDALLRLRALFVIVLPLLALLISLWQLIKTLQKKSSK